MLELYEEIQKNTSWQQTKKQCQELHSELSYMKENKKYFQAVEKTAAGNRLF